MDVPERKRIARTMLDQGATVPEITKALGYKGDIATRQLLARIRKEDHPAPKRPSPPKTAPSASETTQSTPSPALGAAPTVGQQSELDLLTEMLEALWPDARAGKLGAIDRVMKIQQRRAELGVQEPTVLVDGNVSPEGVSNVDKFLHRLAQRSANHPGRTAS